MLYALLGDLHSNIEDTQAVLNHIQQTAEEAKIIGLGDLYECTVSKKKAQTLSGLPLQKAAIVESEFEKLLTFPQYEAIKKNALRRLLASNVLKLYLRQWRLMAPRLCTDINLSGM